eukprot:scaffold874_cov126-Cylindrotheca_fusiformis.AAC.12
MATPLHLFLQDMITEKTAESGVDKLNVSMAVDNHRTNHRTIQRMWKTKKPQKNLSLDVSDHSRRHSRWDSDGGKSTPNHTPSLTMPQWRRARRPSLDMDPAPKHEASSAA